MESTKVTACTDLSKYVVGDVIAIGGFSKVYRGTTRDGGMPVAIKVMPKLMVCEFIDGIPIEIVVLKYLGDVEGVSRMLDFYINANDFTIVLERNYNAIDLFKFKEDFQFVMSEDLAMQIFSGLLDIVIEIYDRGIVHRDIKLENIMIDKSTFRVTIIDFGCVGRRKSSPYRYFRGTREYYPPEWFRDRQCTGEAMTVWSLGVVLYIMLKKDDDDSVDFNLDDYVSLPVSMIVSSMLKKEEAERCTLKELRSLVDEVMR